MIDKKIFTQLASDLKKYNSRTFSLFILNKKYIVPFSLNVWDRVFFDVPQLEEYMDEYVKYMNTLSISPDIRYVDDTSKDSKLDDVKWIIEMFINIDRWIPIDEEYDGFSGRWIEEILTLYSVCKPKKNAIRDFNVVDMDIDSNNNNHTKYVLYGFSQIPKSKVWINSIAQWLV